MTMKPTEKTAKIQSKGPFSPGQSGNPAGRPKGARNKSTLAIEALLDGEAEKLTRKVVELALAGDTTAIKLCLDRICPPRKERPVMTDLPEIHNAQDAVRVVGNIIAAVSRGELLPGEGQALANMVEGYRKIIETADLEHRIAALEESHKNGANNV